MVYVLEIPGVPGDLVDNVQDYLAGKFLGGFHVPVIEYEGNRDGDLPRLSFAWTGASRGLGVRFAGRWTRDVYRAYAGGLVSRTVVTAGPECPGPDKGDVIWYTFGPYPADFFPALSGGCVNV